MSQTYSSYEPHVSAYRDYSGNERDSVNNSFYNVRAVSASTSANAGDLLLVTTGAGTITITLPPVEFGGPVIVKKVDSGAGAIKVVTADSSTIDNVAGATGRTQAATQYAVWRLDSDHAGAWFVLN